MEGESQMADVNNVPVVLVIPQEVYKRAQEEAARRGITTEELLGAGFGKYINEMVPAATAQYLRG